MDVIVPLDLLCGPTTRKFLTFGLLHRLGILPNEVSNLPANQVLRELCAADTPTVALLALTVGGPDRFRVTLKRGRQDAFEQARISEGFRPGVLAGRKDGVGDLGSTPARRIDRITTVHGRRHEWPRIRSRDQNGYAMTMAAKSWSGAAAAQGNQ